MLWKDRTEERRAEELRIRALYAAKPSLAELVASGDVDPTKSETVAQRVARLRARIEASRAIREDLQVKPMTDEKRAALEADGFQVGDYAEFLTLSDEDRAKVDARCAAWDRAMLGAIRAAIRDYHYALDTCQHGSVAGLAAIGAIQDALAMPWVKGAEKARRDAEGKDS